MGDDDDRLAPDHLGNGGVHFLLILIIFGQTELLIDFLVLGKCVDYGLNAFAHDVYHTLLIVERRLLRQITHGVAR